MTDNSISEQNTVPPEVRRRRLLAGDGGFTMFEMLIVLLIILLFLYAVFRLSLLTGYIDKAAERKLMAETRQAVIAAQALLDEEYAKSDINKAYAFDTLASDGRTETVIPFQAVADLGEVDASCIASITVGTGMERATVVELVYAFNGRTCTYRLEDSRWEFTLSPREPAGE